MSGNSLAPNERWFVRVPEGYTYGPVRRQDLEQWVREGRIDAQCQLRLTDDADWLPAAEFFPVLAEVAARPTSFRPDAAVGQAELPTILLNEPGPISRLLPDRGSVVLLLGILGVVVACPGFSIGAWMLGTRDLQEIQTGARDPAGAALTRIGRMLGIVATAIWLVLILLILFAVLVGKIG